MFLCRTNFFQKENNYFLAFYLFEKHKKWINTDIHYIQHKKLSLTTILNILYIYVKIKCWRQGFNECKHKTKDFQRNDLMFSEKKNCEFLTTKKSYQICKRLCDFFFVLKTKSVFKQRKV